MLTFLQNNLGQPATDKPADEVASDNFEQRVGSLMNQLGQAQPGSEHNPKLEPEVSPTLPTSVPKPLSDMGTALAEFPTITNELARVDLMIAQVMDGAPEGDDAKRFQEISLKALKWSRDMLCQKQKCCLAQLGAVAYPNAEPAGHAAETEKTPELESDPETPKWMGWSKTEVAACREFVPSPVVAAKSNLVGGGSLRQDLEFLRKRSPEHVIIVRKIKKLGFESPTLLKEHFLQHGEVSEVLVAHSHVKATSKRPNGRIRPAALGFVVMVDEEGVKRALEAGQEQVVHNTVIGLSPFSAFEEVELEAYKNTFQ